MNTSMGIGHWSVTTLMALSSHHHSKASKPTKGALPADKSTGLWRAVDQTGMVLDVLVQRRCDKRTAKRLLRKLLKRQMRPPHVMITDKLASYGATKREVMPSIEHRQHKGLNNSAENLHQPTHRRERR
jgi:transposase-like protein